MGVAIAMQWSRREPNYTSLLVYKIGGKIVGEAKGMICAIRFGFWTVWIKIRFDVSRIHVYF